MAHPKAGSGPTVFRTVKIGISSAVNKGAGRERCPQKSSRNIVSETGRFRVRISLWPKNLRLCLSQASWEGWGKGTWHNFAPLSFKYPPGTGSGERSRTGKTWNHSGPQKSPPNQARKKSTKLNSQLTLEKINNTSNRRRPKPPKSTKVWPRIDEGPSSHRKKSTKNQWKSVKNRWKLDQISNFGRFLVVFWWLWLFRAVDLWSFLVVFCSFFGRLFLPGLLLVKIYGSFGTVFLNGSTCQILGGCWAVFVVVLDMFLSLSVRCSSSNSVVPRSLQKGVRSFSVGLEMWTKALTTVCKKGKQNNDNPLVVVGVWQLNRKQTVAAQGGRTPVWEGLC